MWWQVTLQNPHPTPQETLSDHWTGTRTCFLCCCCFFLQSWFWLLRSGCQLFLCAYGVHSFNAFLYGAMTLSKILGAARLCDSFSPLSALYLITWHYYDGDSSPVIDCFICTRNRGDWWCCFIFVFQGSNVVEDQDLLEIGILNSAHRQRLLQAIRLLPRVSTPGGDRTERSSLFDE